MAFDEIVFVRDALYYRMDIVPRVESGGEVYLGTRAELTQIDPNTQLAMGIVIYFPDLTVDPARDGEALMRMLETSFKLEKMTFES